MPHTIKIDKRLEDMVQRELEAPSIYELSLMTLKQQIKKIKKWLKIK